MRAHKQIAFALTLLAPLPAAAECLPLTVTRAVDGDTVEVQLTDGVRSMRLEGIDAPEFWQPKCDAEYRLGVVAKDYLQSRIDNAESIEVCSDFKEADWNRFVGHLKIDGEMISFVMIDKLLARPWDGKRRPWCVKREIFRRGARTGLF